MPVSHSFRNIFSLLCFCHISLSFDFPSYAKVSRCDQSSEHHNEMLTIMHRFDGYISDNVSPHQSSSSVCIVDALKHASEKPEERTIGVCFPTAFGRKTIFIEKEWWINSNQYGKEILLFHELSHCELGLAHIDDPVDIMNPILPTAFEYFLDREFYLTRLFTRVNVLQKLYNTMHKE